MAKIVIVLTYYQRQNQLDKTLLSIAKTNHTNFEVIIVDDCSPVDINLPELPYKPIIRKLENKTWAGTSSVHNEGFIEAIKLNPEIIIIQNAECYHAGDVLSYAEKIKEDEYFAFACYSLAKGEEPITITNDKRAEFDGESAWYNHPVHRPLAYHFCSAIRTENLIKLNGFDERFSPGIAYEDDMFVHQIRNLGLDIKIPVYPFVFHQYHYDGMNRDVELIKKNAELFTELKNETTFRAVHTITPDL